VSKSTHPILSSLVAGVLVITPVYLAALLLLKAISSLGRLLKPLAELLPAWMPAAQLLSVVLILTVCLLLGLAIRTAPGRALRNYVERAVFDKIPGYTLLRGFTQRLAGENEGEAWKPALAEIEEALVPAFIIEVLADGRYTVFVPSVPTPLSGAVYVLNRDRVHPLDVAFTQAMRTVSRWGSGCKDLVAALERTPQSATPRSAA
jgi:uncharacterized membrane protein